MNPPGIGISQAFASPIVHSSLADCAALNRRLRELFLRWEQDTKARTSLPTQVVKVGVYESSFDLFHKADPEIQQLTQFCLQTLGYVIAQLNGYSAEEMAELRIFHHSWYHLTRDGGYTAQHNHPMASWSGVYCVDPGDVLPDRPNNGALRFLEARGTAGMYLDPGNADMRSPFGFGDIAFDLQPCQLLLFPSYLLHEVAPYHGERERITVAFNAWVRYAGEPALEPGVRLRKRKAP